MKPDVHSVEQVVLDAVANGVRRAVLEERERCARIAEALSEPEVAAAIREGADDE